jgi:hypothetical protein
MWSRLDKTDLVIGATLAVVGGALMPDITTSAISGLLLAGGAIVGIAIGRAQR